MSEWIAYLDESQRKSTYLVGAALARQETWEAISDDIDVLRDEICVTYGLPIAPEFHGHPLMNSRQGWEPLAGRHREISEIYRRVLNLANRDGVFYYVRGVDTVELRQRYKYPENPTS